MIYSQYGFMVVVVINDGQPEKFSSLGLNASGDEIMVLVNLNQTALVCKLNYKPEGCVIPLLGMSNDSATTIAMYDLELTLGSARIECATQSTWLPPHYLVPQSSVASYVPHALRFMSACELNYRFGLIFL